MSVNLRDKTALWWDNGLFLHGAIRCAETFGRTLYGGPYINAFPKSNSVLPGAHIPGIERIRDWEPYIDEADIFIFPDVMFGPTQVLLEKMGKRVFGSRMGENLELKRWATKRLLRDIGMPVQESHFIVGIPALRKFLQTHLGKWWIKTSRFRGDFETFSSESYDEIRYFLDALESPMMLGMKAGIYPFIVERDIPALTEFGYDGICVNGKFSDRAWFGCEIKDLGWLGMEMGYKEMPLGVQWVNHMLGAYFEMVGYRGFWSTEIRAVKLKEHDWREAEESDTCICTPRNEIQTVPGTDMVVFLTDPTARMASPPSELDFMWAENWPLAIWMASEGKVVPLKCSALYGCEFLIHSPWADKNWQNLKYPEEISPWVKLRNMTIIGGENCTVPQNYSLPEVGAVVAVGDSVEEVVETCVERGQQVVGYMTEVMSRCKDEAITEFSKAMQYANPTPRQKPRPEDHVDSWEREPVEHGYSGGGGVPISPMPPQPVTPQPPSGPIVGEGSGEQIGGEGGGGLVGE